MRSMVGAILYFMVASAITSLLIYSQLRGRSEWRGMALRHKAACIAVMPIAVAIMLLFMIPVMLLASVVSIIGGTYVLTRLVLLGKRPPLKAFDDPDLEARSDRV
ncbi:hypothetical protein PLANPX_5537 [Lacipirellula parvula]|uniref:Uncharacterized protein n=1 Tax=Lacipirellula parvula TaxID=2650471 RepID=A0A5K7XHQ1_9BACT|nr:hypothetical protein PLANPX_5537 [Lacipirellula parvula]